MELSPEDISKFIFLIVGAAISYAFNRYNWNKQRQTTATENNTVQVAELKGKMDMVIKYVEKIPEMEKDLNGLHAKIRVMTAKEISSEPKVQI